MGKKRAAKAVEEEKPEIWCFYCDRQYDEEKILIEHQKARHFKCEECGKPASTDNNEYKNKRDKASRKVAWKEALRAQHLKDRSAAQSSRTKE